MVLGKDSSNRSASHKMGKHPRHQPNKKTKPNAKVIKFHSESCIMDSNNHSEFAKLDKSKPEHLRRMQQRRRMIGYGKNTVGYEIYTSKVPKEKRRPRSMDTPSTPDHTLDIPNKRWIGQVRAWRRALHKYDPPDLQKSVTAEQSSQPATTTPDDTDMTATPKVSVQDQELARAKSAGLLVAFDEAASSSASSPEAVSKGSSSSEMNDLDQWDLARGDDTFLCSDDEDSDDDLL